MSRLAEEYVFERLAMLEKEHDEHLKGSSVNVEKEAENSDGVEFKKEPITAVRYDVTVRNPNGQSDSLESMRDAIQAVIDSLQKDVFDKLEEALKSPSENQKD